MINVRTLFIALIAVAGTLAGAGDRASVGNEMRRPTAGKALSRPTVIAQQPRAPVTVPAFAMPTIPARSVKFCHLPFLDHTQAIIGVRKGWFAEAGIAIEPAPHGVVITPPQRMAAHASGQCEVSSGATGAAIAVHKAMPDLVMFVVGDIFQGEAILVRADGGYKTYQDFVKEGLQADEAVKRAMAQLKGKRGAVALAPATQFSSNLFLKEGGLSPDDVTILSVDDSKTVQLMITRQADFQLGGAPARVELEGKGFAPLITIGDLAGKAKPSSESTIQRALYPDGWMISRKVWQRDPDLVLRLAGVMWRITDLIVNRQSEALAIHVPFLNSISGRTITEEEGRRIYEKLDPFLTFRDSARLFTNAQDPMYWKWELGSKIRAQVEAGVYKPDELKPEDVTVAPEVYARMQALEKESETLIARADAALRTAATRGANVAEARSALDRARAFKAVHNFLDAQRFAAAVDSWATKVVGR
jgi:ABC-type nitrate/sulfonate/bicarbonate transport system substrate-binding protein